jgi:acyl transferase domain-containing protein
MSAAMPIAVIGRGAVLPGAHDLAELWARVMGRDDLTGPSTAAMWGLQPSAVCADPVEPSACARGGYVTGFAETWRPEGFLVAPDLLATLPEGWQWLLHATRESLKEAAISLGAGTRAGLALGSLGYATRAFADVAARRWCGEVDADSPALEGQTGALHWTMQACGLEGPRLALDAACASGLYALKAACDALQARRADVMVAAGLNAADDLFLHIGFTALSALSPTGRSSPLSTEADGLLPAEGAAALVLKRLDDAVAAGDRILGIIRGVGLSNDGRGSGLLAPTTNGQQRAIRGAYAAAGLDPSSVEYLECHATGTLVGDREEMLSVRAVFGDALPMRLGSLKAQLGHLITASGTAGLLKILGAFEHDTTPPAPRVSLEHPIDILRESALVLPEAAASWTPGRAPRRAAINAFGFGGCNAHAVIDGPEAADELARKPRTKTRKKVAPEPEIRTALALVACEVAVGAAADTTATLRVLLGLDPATRRIGDISLALKGLGFPPADLQQTLPQQLLLLRAAQALKPHLDGLDRERLGVFIGTDVDPAGARHGCRWRLDQLLGRPASEAEKDAVVPALQAAAVLGTMPNMPANRLNSALDARGPGMVVSDGMASGRTAFEMAAHAIARAEIDAAIVGAVDASGGAFGDDPALADTALLMLLVPAVQVGEREVLAIFEPAPDEPASPTPQMPWPDSGAAHELLQLAVGALCCRHAMWPADPAQPWIAADRVLHLQGWRVRAPRVQGLLEDAPAMSVAATDAAPAGELAWVFTGAAAAYPGAGRTLLRAFPEVGDELRAMAPRLAATLPALLAQRTLSLIDQLQLATLVSQAQALLLRRAGVEPAATLGLSSGETNAIMATRAWTDPDDLFADVERSGMYDRHLAGRHETLRTAWGLGPDEPVSWRCYRIIHPVAELHTAVARRERVRVLIVHHERDAVIGGDDEICKALIAELGASAVPINHDLLVHCVELEPFAQTWYDVHHRTTNTFDTPRLYANAVHGVFTPTADRCAEMLTTQARSMVEFHPTVERAYADGVRTFVELGPRAACTGWIDDILGERPHTAAAVDGTRGSLRDLAETLDAVAAAGHPVRADWWNAQVTGARLLPAAEARATSAATIHLQGHLPLPSIDAPRPRLLRLPPAPALAPALPEQLRPVWTPATELAMPVYQSGMTLPTAALAALAHTQEALLQVQHLAVAHLVTADAEPTAFIDVPLTWMHAENDSAPTMTVDAAVAVNALVANATAAASAADRPLPGAPPAAALALAFTREQLAIHAGGRISEIFGPLFVKQDASRRQVRMPMEPLLLADRVPAWWASRPA